MKEKSVPGLWNLVRGDHSYLSEWKLAPRNLCYGAIPYGSQSRHGCAHYWQRSTNSDTFPGQSNFLSVSRSLTALASAKHFCKFDSVTSVIAPEVCAWGPRARLAAQVQAWPSSKQISAQASSLMSLGVCTAPRKVHLVESTSCPTRVLNSSSVSKPRFAIARFFTAARIGARWSAMITRPNSLHFRSILSRPLFLPNTILRRAPTNSDEYGSIASGM
jgi:hypothetical protein